MVTREVESTYSPDQLMLCIACQGLLTCGPQVRVPTIFVNLPVADIERSRKFFADLVYTANEWFSGDTRITVVLGAAVRPPCQQCSTKRGWVVKPPLHRTGLVGGGLSSTAWQSRSAGTSASIFFRKARNSWLWWQRGRALN